jgi:hypothetical protein
MVAGLTTLKDSVAVLLQTWLLSFPSWAQSISPATTAIEAVLDKTRARCRRVLEKLFKIEPLEVLDSIVAHWVTLAASEVSFRFEPKPCLDVAGSSCVRAR